MADSEIDLGVDPRTFEADEWLARLACGVPARGSAV